uniref:Tetraspanin n=1 Tax=Esox lucius TaxID=8010 RepID=A0AAY5K1S7_ESOLU
MKVDDKLQILKFLASVVNCVFLILGLCLFGCGIWLLFDKNNFVTVLSTDDVRIVAGGLFIIGLVVVGVTILGCIGTQLENRCFLLLFMGFLFCIVLGQLFVTVILLLKWKKIETTMLGAVNKTIHEYGSSSVDRVYWDDVQHYGCQVKITSWLEANILTIMGMDMGLLFIQILQFVVSVYLYQTAGRKDQIRNESPLIHSEDRGDPNTNNPDYQNLNDAYYETNQAYGNTNLAYPEQILANPEQNLD